MPKTPRKTSKKRSVKGTSTKAGKGLKKIAKRVGKAASPVKKAAKKATKATTRAVKNPKRTVQKAAANVSHTAERARGVGDTLMTAGEMVKQTADLIDSVAQRAAARSKTKGNTPKRRPK